MVDYGQLNQFEYLDHTADIMFVWGDNLGVAFEQMALAMMNYMVELDSVHLDQHQEDEIKEHTINVEEFLVFKEIKVLSIDKINFKITATGKGVELDKSKHTTGTEIKAITYSCMKIEEKPEKTDIYLLRNKLFNFVNWIHCIVLKKQYSLSWQCMINEYPELLIDYRFDDRYLYEYLSKFGDANKHEQPPFDRLKNAMLAAIRQNRLDLIETIINKQPGLWHSEIITFHQAYQEELCVTAAAYEREDILRYLIDSVGVNSTLVMLATLKSTVATNRNLNIARQCCKFIVFDEYISNIIMAIAPVIKLNDSDIFMMLYNCSASIKPIAIKGILKTGTLDLLNVVKEFEKKRFSELVMSVGDCISTAAKYNQLEILQYLLENQLGKKENADKYLSCRSDTNFEIIQCLYDYYKDSIVSYPLLISKAIVSGNVRVLEFLLSLGRLSDDEKSKCFATNPMNYAAKNNHFDMLKWLHYNRSEPVTKSVMEEAILSNNMAMVQFLVENRTEGCTNKAIQYALEVRNLELAQYLFDNISGVNWQMRNDLLETLCYNGCLDIIRFVLEYIPLEHSFSRQAMIYSAANGFLEILKLIHQSPNSGSTFKTMDAAAANGHLDIVVWLNENRTEGCSVSAIDGAAGKGHLDVVKWLYFNRSEGFSSTGMDNALANGHTDVLEFLYENRTQDCSPRSIQLAAEYGHLNVLKWLIANQSDDDVNDLQFPLREHAKRGDLEAIKYLYEIGRANIDHSTLEFATIYDRFNVVLWILENHFVKVDSLDFGPFNNALLDSYRSDPNKTLLKLKKLSYCQINNIPNISF
ncbi:hypothetical protein PPL_09194 [Heterostelium album PN500]|uniref:Archease domain-containing protein n=1 Tax=Heterostelium pallidum (strain ATCC 26659 / Pp 5 / PN500) TaxID=670386 RepID=D3BKW2_HETP5|nr:hypothetical protein PPL_09194 [Heterostelium album PN500]EFA78542.1 hypothetical protein PPL_09194 [Heterostelium album PN500]|eukprot:XP_020430666.1 hypothetical protein PPL_09194 [Heterostelium album PN500]